MPDASMASAAVSTIAVMVTPGLLMLGSASLAASALVRMARIVDRARVLAELAVDKRWVSAGITPELLRGWLERHRARARYAARSIALLYAAIVLFVATCLSIAADRMLGSATGWSSLCFALCGTLLLLGGAIAMVAESRLSGEQIGEEIDRALNLLKGVST